MNVPVQSGLYTIREETSIADIGHSQGNLSSILEILDIDESEHRVRVDTLPEHFYPHANYKRHFAAAAAITRTAYCPKQECVFGGELSTNHCHAPIWRQFV